MNYIAITEVKEIPLHIEPKEYSQEDFDKILSDMKKGFHLQSVDITPKIPAKMLIRLSEETFKFIDSVAIVSTPVFGEKEYKINDLKFTIHTEEEYEKRYGKFEQNNL